MRGRVGTAFDRLLIYTTGGVAVAQRNFTNGYVFQSPDGQDFSIGSASQTATGLAIGGGLEYALTRNWTLKGEYLYANLGAGKSSLPDGMADPRRELQSRRSRRESRACGHQLQIRLALGRRLRELRANVSTLWLVQFARDSRVGAAFNHPSSAPQKLAGVSIFRRNGQRRRRTD